MANRNDPTALSVTSKGPGIMKTPLGEFQIGKTLGEGSYGKVKLIVNVKNGDKLAVKIIRRFVPPDPETGNKGRGGKTFEQRILREANLTRFLRHPHIVPLKDCRITKSHFYLFHEYISGCQLTDKIGRNGLKVEVAAHYFEQIIDAIGYCHSNFVVHRDIKVENIMIDKDDNVKIIDFGLANFFDQKNALKTFCGSLQYSAPEIMRGDPYIGPEVDIWSIGVVLFAMLTGTLPFDDPRNPGAWECVMNGKIKWTPNMHPTPKSIITRLLDPNPKRRITMPEIAKHPFIAKRASSNPNTIYRPTNHRTLPAKLDRSIISEMTACMFQSEYSILQQLEEEMKKGKEQDGYITVSNSPLVAVYHLIANTREKTKVETTQLQADKPAVTETKKVAPNPIPRIVPQPKEQNEEVAPVKPVENEMRRNATDNHPGVVVEEENQFKRVYSENGAINVESPKPKPENIEPYEAEVIKNEKPIPSLSRRAAVTEGRRRRAYTIGGGEELDESTNSSEPSTNSTNFSNTMERVRSTNDKGYNSGSENGTWDKETYKAKRASMYETYRKMNEDLRLELEQKDRDDSLLNSQRRKEIYKSKRASLYEGFYSKQESKENKEVVESITKNHDKKVDESGDIQIKIEDEMTKVNGGRRNSVKRRITIYKLGRKPTLKKKSSKPEVTESEVQNTESETESVKERIRNHLKEKEMINKQEAEPMPVYERESSLKDKDENTIEPDSQAAMIFKGLKEGPIETARLKKDVSDAVKESNGSLTPNKMSSPAQNGLRSPFLTTSPLLVSPISGNRTNMSEKVKAMMNKKVDENGEEPMVLPIISNQKKYLDKLLSDYRNRASQDLTKGEDNKPKKKVTFKDSNEEEYENESDTTITDSKVSVNEKVIVENKAQDIYNKLAKQVYDNETSDSEPEDKYTKDFSKDGKVGIFKSPKQNTKEIVDDLATYEAKAMIAATTGKSPKAMELTINRVEIENQDINTAIDSLLKSKATLPSFNSIKKKEEVDVIPGVRQVSITECLKSKVIKIAKVDISELCDQFLDMLSERDIEYDWLETAFFFKVLIPISKLAIENEHVHAIEAEVELVQVAKAKSSAILLVDNNTFDKNVLRVLKTSQSELEAVIQRYLKSVI